MLYLNVLQLIWHYFLLPFYYNLLHSYCNLLLFTIFYCKLPHFYRKLPHRLIKIFKKKIYQKLLQFTKWPAELQFTAIYCIYTAIYNNNLLHLVVLQFYFLLFRRRNTDYFLLQYYFNLLHSYCILTAIYCFYYFLLQFTASLRFPLVKFKSGAI